MFCCNAASKVTMLSMGSLKLLLRASVFTVLDLNEMGGTTLPREVLRANLSRPVRLWPFQDKCSVLFFSFITEALFPHIMQATFSLYVVSCQSACNVWGYDGADECT